MPRQLRTSENRFPDNQPVALSLAAARWPTRKTQRAWRQAQIGKSSGSSLSPHASPRDSRLSNHLIRPPQHGRRNCQANLLRRFQIDHKLELRRLFDRKIGRLGALENLINEYRRAAKQVVRVGTV